MSKGLLRILGYIAAALSGYIGFEFGLEWWQFLIIVSIFSVGIGLQLIADRKRKNEHA